MNYEEFLSRTGAMRQPSPLRRFNRIGRETTMPLINMSPGLPNTDLFYLTGAKFQLRDGSTVELSKEDLQVAQNYSYCDGIKPLICWMRELTVKLHHPPTLDDRDKERAFRVLINHGGCHGVNAVARLVLDRGAKCLVMERSYPTVLEGLRVLGADLLPIRLEKDGPDMVHFRKILSHWTPADKDMWAHRPKLFYVIPNGNNPSGETLSLEKRRQIYALAQEYDFIILEDDAYYFMQYDKPRLPSFLSMDVDGRVVRVDSVSKIVGAGFRIGWVSGPSAILTPLMFDIQINMQHASVLSQMVLFRMFDQWGIEGFLSRTERVREFYKRRRDIVVEAATKHLTGMATWTVPQAGMFLWIKLPAVENVEAFLLGTMHKKGVLLTPGDIFQMDQQHPSQSIRVAFSVCPEEDLREGIKRLAEAIKEDYPNRSTESTEH